MEKTHEINSLDISGHLLRWLVTPLCLVMTIFFYCATTRAAENEAEREVVAAEAAAETAKDNSAGKEATPRLSFTDDDLKKYQRPRADGDDDAAVLEGIDEEGKGTPPPAPQGAPLVRTPVKIAKPPVDDPLKEFKAREEREKFRSQQVETLRDGIAGLEQRLAYLQQKRLAIIDPLRIMPKPESADEGVKDAGLGSGELLTSVEAEIESTEASLKSAQDNLVTIQTRFGAEAR